MSRKFMFMFYFIFMVLKNHADGIIITIEKLEMCSEPKDLPVKAYFNVTNQNTSSTLISARVIFPEDFGNQYMMISKFETQFMNRWVKLLQIRQNNPCRVGTNLLGPIALEVERHFNMDPGACPIKKGTYETNNISVDYNKLPMKLPLGTLKFSGILKKNDQIHGCLEIIFNLKK